MLLLPLLPFVLEYCISSSIRICIWLGIDLRSGRGEETERLGFLQLLLSLQSKSIDPRRKALKQGLPRILLKLRIFCTKEGPETIL